ncbi:hypothetical protein GX50_00864 [[Emmonsia] crescens]|uniref:Uncharacterized protein n=1 Tax=[Emmonsia] crescens TaxID=73230 RepID=A0A2B7ZT52_9EURO|nr:hypothetical protein GX50_00864 [Emmonsia crescens]
MISRSRGRHICTLPLEASVAAALFDKQYDDWAYGKVPGDSNTYSVGVIGHHNVVLIHRQRWGKLSRQLKRGYPRKDIFLGDVVISEGLIQYDLGRRLPDNRFLRKDTPQDNLPRPRPEIRSTLAKLQTEQGRRWLQSKTSQYLKDLNPKLGDLIQGPGMMRDRLFKSTHRHKHYGLMECAKCANEDGTNKTCYKAFGTSCEELRCHQPGSVLRTQLSLSSSPAVHFGIVASGGTVLKPGED